MLVVGIFRNAYLLVLVIDVFLVQFLFVHIIGMVRGSFVSELVVDIVRHTDTVVELFAFAARGLVALAAGGIGRAPPAPYAATLHAGPGESHDSVITALALIVIWIKSK